MIRTCLWALCPCAVSTVFRILPGWWTPVFGTLKKLSLEQAVGTEKLQPERINVLVTLSDHGGPTRYCTPRFLPQLRLESSSPVDSTPVDDLPTLMPGILGCEILSCCLCGTPPYVFLVPERFFLSPRRAKCGLQPGERSRNDVNSSLTLSSCILKSLHSFGSLWLENRTETSATMRAELTNLTRLTTSSWEVPSRRTKVAHEPRFDYKISQSRLRAQ